MRTRYFEIGDNDWGFLLCWDYSIQDYDDMWAILKAFDVSDKDADKSLRILSRPNTGLTVTDFHETMSLVFVSETTSEDEWIDTLFHEIKHVVEHISAFYKVSPQSEPAAYLQGEIGRQLFPVIMERLCSPNSGG